jgi:hypothetical protein
MELDEIKSNLPVEEGGEPQNMSSREIAKLS